MAPTTDPVQLKNWDAPLHWSPSKNEGGAKREASEALDVADTKSPRSKERAAATGATDFVAITPCRVVDTRPEYFFPVGFGAPRLGAGETRTFNLSASTSRCPVPPGVLAYSTTVTVCRRDRWAT
ncbi:MAG: hypothetical protein WDO18_11080 [Acidobacteriota bacterium]